MTDHLVPLPGTDWQLWRWGLLRAAGFPADGLELFTAPECAALADTDPDGEEFAAAFATACDRIAEQAVTLAADPLLREAITWQNPSALHALDGLLRGTGRSAKQRQRREALARYWQRYCGKNETVGFFGPVCWVDVDPSAPAVTVQAGPSLTRRRQLFFEYWALAAYDACLADDPEVRPWLPVRRPPHLTLAGTELRMPTGAPRQLPAVDAAILARCT
ncbi:MAG: lantibiotic dehydratase, partial [Actinocatenispora sp.]